MVGKGAGGAVGVGAEVGAVGGVAVAAGSVGLGVSGAGTGVAVAAGVAADAAVGAIVGGDGVGSCPQAVTPRTARAAPQIISDIKRRTTTNFSNLLGFLKLILILTQHTAAASSPQSRPMDYG